MYANQLVDTLAEYKSESFSLSKNWIIESLQSSIKFHLGDLSDSIDNMLLTRLRCHLDGKEHLPERP